ncbi:MAG: shikimate kinase [Desulfatiglandales bacterium]
MGTSWTHGLFLLMGALFVNIVLIGPRWSGKTEAGRILAARIGSRFIDTDDMVEEMAGVSINILVRDAGWGRFRDMEALAVRRAALEDGLVIATGGGVVTRAENVRCLRRNGWIVWLKATEETLKKRMGRDSGNGDSRPSLHGIGPAEEIRRVLRERTPHYCHAGDLSVETDALSPFEVTELIVAGTPQKLKR